MYAISMILVLGELAVIRRGARRRPTGPAWTAHDLRWGTYKYPNPGALPNTATLAVPPERGAWVEGWTRCTHVAPAAHPRRAMLRAPDGKADPADILRRRAEHYAGRWETLDEEDALWTVMERFVRVDRSPDTGRPVTLFCVHANGLHKDTFDETLRQLLATGIPGGDVVSEVWTLDAVTHGEGARVNAAALPDIFDWTDHACDIEDFLLGYLPAVHSSDTAPPPPVLPRLSDAEMDARRKGGYPDRTLVALGHSQGGACVILAAHDAPTPFDSIILADPLVVSPVHKEVNHDRYVVGAGTLGHHEEASDMLLSSPYFKRWDPAVFEAYLEHGMYTESAPPFRVRLKCPPYQEASSFSETHAPVLAWYRLAELPERITLFFILANQAESRG